MDYQNWIIFFRLHLLNNWTLGVNPPAGSGLSRRTLYSLNTLNTSTQTSKACILNLISASFPSLTRMGFSPKFDFPLKMLIQLIISNKIKLFLKFVKINFLLCNFLVDLSFTIPSVSMDKFHNKSDSVYHLFNYFL